MRTYLYDVKGIQKTKSELTYDDLVTLFQQYIDIHHEFPVQNDCYGRNNLPHGRIIKKILDNNNVTWNTFCNGFGKYKHVRTEENEKYDEYVEKYKQVSNSAGHALKMSELVNNTYGLPSAKWLVENCPSKQVVYFDDFVKWCGFDSNKLKIDDSIIKQKLIKLDNSLNREITYEDISTDKIGFSTIAITRLFGTLTNAKKQLGLKQIKNVSVKASFQNLKDDLVSIFTHMKNDEHRTNFILKELDQSKYAKYPCNHTRYLNSFKRNNENFYIFISKNGMSLASNGNGISHKFKDGEFTKSSLEFTLTSYLRNVLHMKYNHDYFRDVKYSTFTNTDRKIDCDYKIVINDKIYYIELCGMIGYKCRTDWRSTDFHSNTKNEYRDNLILKERLLRENNCSYFIWFKSDMDKGVYKTIFKKEW